MSYFIVSSAPSGLMLSHKVSGEPISLKTLKILLILGWGLPFLADYAQTKILSATDKKSPFNFNEYKDKVCFIAT